MTTYSSREELENLVITRHLGGWSNRKLARDLGVGRNTVRKILQKYRQQRAEGHDRVAQKKSVRHDRANWMGLYRESKSC